LPDVDQIDFRPSGPDFLDEIFVYRTLFVTND